MALAIMTPKMPASQFPSVTNARIPPVAPLKAMTTSRTSAKRRKEKPSSVPESGLSVATVEDFSPLSQWFLSRSIRPAYLA